MKKVSAFVFSKRWLATACMLVATHSLAWELPRDDNTVPSAVVDEILASKDFPATTEFKRRLDYVDYQANGKTFTQVVLTLEPDKPLMHNGKKVVLAATEEGSSSANGFIETDEGKEGIGVWLAKRGVTFIALNGWAAGTSLRPTAAERGRRFL